MDLSEILQQNKVVIFSKPGCKNCKVAQNLVEEEEIPYKYIDIGIYMDEDWFDDFYDNLKQNSGAKVFPIIYIDNEYIGDHKQLELRVPDLRKTDQLITDDF